MITPIDFILEWASGCQPLSLQAPALLLRVQHGVASVCGWSSIHHSAPTGRAPVGWIMAAPILRGLHSGSASPSQAALLAPGSAQPEEGVRGSADAAEPNPALESAPFLPPRTPLPNPRKPQCWRQPVRTPAAQRISAFSTALTPRFRPPTVGVCANGPRTACGASPLGGRVTTRW